MSTKRFRIPGVMTRVLVVALVLAVVACAKDENEKLIKASKEGRTDVVTTLLNSGADVNAKDKEGRAALMFASQKGHTQIVELLKAHGAKE